MRAVVFERFGSPKELHLGEVPTPEPGPAQIRVRVETVGVNAFDGKVRSGAMESVFSTRLPGVPGLEAAGVVDRVGADVPEVVPGDRVTGWTSRGAAEHALLNLWAPIPDNIDAPQAAALPVVTEAAHRALRLLDLAPGETLLIHGASGGVGGLATQLALLAHVRVIGTASEVNHERIATYGAIPTTYGEGLVDRVRALSPTVDAVLDASGHGVLPESIELLGGPDRVVTLADPAARTLGVSFTESPEPSVQDLTALIGQVARGELSVPVAQVLSWDQAEQAARLVEGGHAGGKVVLRT